MDVSILFREFCGVGESYLVVHTEGSKSSLLRFLLIVGDVGISAIEGMMSPSLLLRFQSHSKMFRMFRFVVLSI